MSSQPVALCASWQHPALCCILQIAVKRREAKSKGEKERYKHLNVEFQRIARRDEKPFFRDQSKEIEENNRMGKTRYHFKKIRVVSLSAGGGDRCTKRGREELPHVRGQGQKPGGPHA